MAVRQPFSCTSVTSAVSTSCSCASRGSIRTAPRANTSTTSLPVTKRAMSKSWIVMSRKRPHEVRLSDRPGDDRLAHRGMGGIEPAVEAYLERNAGLLDGGEGTLDLRELQRDRLFAEDRLASLGGGHHKLSVRVGA